MKFVVQIMIILTLMTGWAEAASIRGALLKKVLGRDLLRDRVLRVHRLKKARTVFRYTNRKQALKESRKGIPPGTHMTAIGKSGRPLSPKKAKNRYGLPRKPSVRETVQLKKGTRVKSGKALGGKPGYGELTAIDRIQPKSIRRIVPLRQR